MIHEPSYAEMMRAYDALPVEVRQELAVADHPWDPIQLHRALVNNLITPKKIIILIREKEGRPNG